MLQRTLVLLKKGRGVIWSLSEALARILHLGISRASICCGKCLVFKQASLVLLSTKRRKLNGQSVRAEQPTAHTCGALLVFLLYATEF